MSHPSQLAFIHRLETKLEKQYPDARVLDIVSADVNGSIREYFQFSRSYLGVDLFEGPGVDVVASGHEYGAPGTYDILVSCKAFEHNPYWMETFVNMIRLAWPDGTVTLTCAARGRLEHGTAWSGPSKSPGTSAVGWGYYRNLREKDFMRQLRLANHFQARKFLRNGKANNLYFVEKMVTFQRFNRRIGRTFPSTMRDTARKIIS